MYVTPDEYKAITRANSIEESDLEQELERAQQQIDAMTYNRIVHIRFDALTEFQKKLVKQAVVEQADFNAEYGTALENPLASYGINGVSMSWDKDALAQINGVYTSSGVRMLLIQTGLLYRGVI